MCIRKITVRTGTQYPEGLEEDFLYQITKEFSMYVFPFTTNMRLLRKARTACKSSDSNSSLLERFRIVQDDQYYALECAGKLKRTMRFLGNPKTIYLEYIIGLPGGLGVDTKDGIFYFFHTNERGHMPHIHAKYQGKEISIGILTGEVKGEFKNKKKQREAIGYVEANKQELLERYNQKTNGIHIDSFFIVDGEQVPESR